MVDLLYSLLVISSKLDASNVADEFVKGLGKSAFEAIKARLVAEHDVKSLRFLKEAEENPAFEAALRADLAKPEIAQDVKLLELAEQLWEVIEALPAETQTRHALNIEAIRSSDKLLVEAVEGLKAETVNAGRDITIKQIEGAYLPRNIRSLGTTLGNLILPERTERVAYLEKSTLVQFKKGIALLKAPRKMWLEIPERVQLVISPKGELSIEDRAKIEKRMTGRGKVDEYKIDKVGKKMSAALLSDERLLEVQPLSSEEQNCDFQHPISWVWSVVPRKSGKTNIYLRVTILEDENGCEFTVDNEVLHEAIEIEAQSWFTTPRRFWRDNWKWVLSSSGGLAVVAAALAAYTAVTGDQPNTSP